MENKDWSIHTGWVVTLHSAENISHFLLEEILGQAHEKGISSVVIDRVLEMDDGTYEEEIQHIIEQYKKLGLLTSFAFDFPLLDDIFKRVEEVRTELGQPLPQPYSPRMYHKENSAWSYRKDWSVILHDIKIITPKLLEEILSQAYQNGVSYLTIDTGFGTDGDDYVLADDYTFETENRIVQEKYEELGLHMNYTF